MAAELQGQYVITRYDSFSVILEECPRAGELLAEYGLHCANCFLNEYDSIELGADRHGMSEADMTEMLDEINTQLEKEWRLQLQ
ncbi:MAG TPA: hypothetical protein VHQ86_06305 [Candidatus Saccharimonadia bacterium]|jgi:hypothetical protein|nr:hypothetical protein [Candidatus Saccharimonadia bacterium]